MSGGSENLPWLFFFACSAPPHINLQTACSRTHLLHRTRNLHGWSWGTRCLPKQHTMSRNALQLPARMHSPSHRTHNRCRRPEIWNEQSSRPVSGGSENLPWLDFFACLVPPHISFQTVCFRNLPRRNPHGLTWSSRCLPQQHTMSRNAIAATNIHAFPIAQNPMDVLKHVSLPHLVVHSAARLYTKKKPWFCFQPCASKTHPCGELNMLAQGRRSENHRRCCPKPCISVCGGGCHQ